ncbi:MAG: Rpn family recombination-promoting nuclease/putative transposase [Clostridium sp.]
MIDVRAKTLKGEHIDIEVQLTNQGNMDKRTLFYWGKMYLENIKQGEDYENLEKVITINILDFEFLGTKNYQSSFHLWEDVEKDYMLTDVVEIHFLELPKFRNKKNKDYRENDIERWLMFLEKDTLSDKGSSTHIRSLSKFHYPNVKFGVSLKGVDEFGYSNRKG